MIATIAIFLSILVYEIIIILAYKKIDPQTKLVPPTISKYINDIVKTNDVRSTIEILKDLNEKKIEVYPNIMPKNYIRNDGLAYKKSRIFPLGGISNMTTILPNELGFYPLIKNDRYGFKNDDKNYQKKIDIAIIGDSYAESCCVKKENSVVSNLIRANYNSLTFGMSGNGPLINLGVLKEYAKAYKPKVVLWFHCSNDIYNLIFELQSKTLNKYIDDPNFSQNLIDIQGDIDDVLHNYLDTFTISKAKEKDNIFFDNIIDYDEEKIKEKFYNIIKLAKNEVNNWGGKFYFVYIPRFIIDEDANKNNRYLLYDDNTYRNKEILINNYNFLNKTVDLLDIEIIDFKKKVFDEFYFPKRLIPSNGGHYNEKGYNELSKLIIKAIIE